MKSILLILAAFTVSITALHAQVSPIPGIDPDVSAAVQTALPPQYAAYGSLILVMGMIFGRAFTALKNNGGLVGIYNAIVHGITKPMLVIACLSLLTVTSCEFLKSPQGRQMVVSLEQLGVATAVASGRLSPGDAMLINDGTAVLTSGDTAMSKVVSLGSVGLDAAASKNIIAPGDVVLIKDAAAVITKAVTPPVTAPEVTSGK